MASATNFKCKACLDPQVSDDDYKAVELDGNKYEGVNQFCYLGDMISAGGGAEASTFTHVRFGWKSFRLLLPLLASRVVYMLLASGVLWFIVLRLGLLRGKNIQNTRISRADKMMIR